MRKRPLAVISATQHHYRFTNGCVKRLKVETIQELRCHFRRLFEGDEIVNSALIERLADTPPSYWAREINQADALLKLAVQSRVTMEQALDACERLRLKPRRFWQLLVKQRRLSDGKSVKPPMQGLGRRGDVEQEQVITAALADFHPFASQRAIARHAATLACERGISRPDEGAIRRNFGKAPKSINLAHELDVSCDLILDECVLEISVLGTTGQCAPAHLIAIFDARTASIIHHEIFCGPATDGDVTSAARTASRQLDHRRKVRVMLPDSRRQSSPPKTSQSVEHISRIGKPFRAGLVIRAVLGPRLGRIKLRTQERHWSAPVPIKPVHIGDAAHVIGTLVKQRNRFAQGAAASTGGRTPVTS
jgi:hypothetical protein